jgi:hypothetical protein
MSAEPAINYRARRAAKRVGLVARKSKSRAGTVNRGGFQLIDPRTNFPVGGEWRFNMSAEEVIEFCKARGTTND